MANLKNGRVLYTAGGCISCHQPSSEAISAGANAVLPSGGAPLVMPPGTLFALNISSGNETGIGTWSKADFVSALQRSVSPECEHYIPAFPYTSYARMKAEDILDIQAYVMSRPSVKSPGREATLPLETVLRRGIGVWKKLALPEPFVSVSQQSAQWNRSAHLVNVAGHCSEGHTQRDVFMVSQSSLMFEGGPHPDGEGAEPNSRDLIGRKKFEDVADLASALSEGEGVGYEHLSSGGMMGYVQANLSHLPDADVMAIALYLASLKQASRLAVVVAWPVYHGFFR